MRARDIEREGEERDLREERERERERGLEDEGRIKFEKAKFLLFKSFGTGF